MEPIELIIRIFVVLHLLAFATILGGVLAETKNFKSGAKVNPGILHGSWLALVTGLIMVGLLYPAGEQVNNLSLSIKGLMITGIFFIGYTYQKKEQTPKWVVPTIGLLTVINLVVAVILGMTVDA
jgi:hypothetical protein